MTPCARNRVLDACRWQIPGDTELLSRRSIEWLKRHNYRICDHTSPLIAVNRTEAARQVVARLVVWLRHPGRCPRVSSRRSDGLMSVRDPHEFSVDTRTAAPDAPWIWECWVCRQDAGSTDHPMDWHGRWTTRRMHLRRGMWEFIDRIIRFMDDDAWAAVHSFTMPGSSTGGDQ